MSNMWRTVSVILMCLGHSLFAADGFSINLPRSPLLRMLKRTRLEPNNGCAEIYGERARALLSTGSSGPGCNDPVTWDCIGRDNCIAKIVPCVKETDRTVTMNYKTWTNNGQCVDITDARFLPGQQVKIVYPASNPDGDGGINALLHEVRHSQKHKVHLKVTRENGKCYVPELELKGRLYDCSLNPPISS